MSSFFSRLRPAGFLTLAGLLLLSPLATVAQTQTDAGEEDPGGEEGEDSVGRVPTNCRSSSDCAPRFSCDEGGKCKYTGIRKAQTQGCLLGPEAALLVLGAAAVAGSRRRR
ncbi:hypothetical protein G4177_21580 [Corallococcus sp. ZKHCc1 1396]|uniref:Uncharacterized protein n=1 Tax=Corallococcus soli TaxID=2710757 RepID=A0ABR9PS57_9BACT|nr:MULTISPECIES: MXAN_6627.5 family MYXO-CTERM protein [Corallococcus]MBE4750766.1 hypothetical protein [Corallococcus soli]MCY1031875.1 hypothetical protein [Corallococcus sp. BB11-1]